MTASKVTRRFPWIPVSALVALVLVSAVATIHLPNDSIRKETTAGLPLLGLTQINAGSATGVLTQQLEAYDPAPQFIPSPMNSSAPELPAGIRPGAKGPFADIPANYTRETGVVVIEPVKLPSSPVEGLKLTELANAPLGMARMDVPPVQAGQRGGQLEVVSLIGGARVATIELPELHGLPTGDWQPLELIGAVTNTGVVGELTVTSSSGVVEIDEYFRALLLRNMLFNTRLPVGFYTFRIGQ